MPRSCIHIAPDYNSGDEERTREIIMNQTTIAQRVAILAFLFAGAAIIAVGAWTEPVAPAPGGNIPIGRGGALHTGRESQWKHPGVRMGPPVWVAYEGGCPSAPSLYTNGFYLGNTSSRCREADRLQGSLQVEDVNLRNASGLNTWASALYSSAPVFRVNSVFTVKAVGSVASEPLSAPKAFCPLPRTPPPGGGVYYRVVGCSGAVHDLIAGSRACSNYNNCGLIGSEFIRRTVGSGFTRVDAATADGCITKTDSDNQARAVSIAYCMELQAP